MAIKVHAPGLATTIQDLGRFGYAHLGVSAAGAADSVSFRLANLLVGNTENAPALEMTIEGATLEFENAATIAVVGAQCATELNGVPVPNARDVDVEPHALLRCGRITAGTRSYLAVGGGLEVIRFLESAATDLSAGFGGLEGRRLRRGDRLYIGTAGTAHPKVLRHGAEPFPAAGSTTTLRVTLSEQHHGFDPDAREIFLRSSFEVTQQWGRTGLRLAGHSIVAHHEDRFLSEGTPLGAVQVPPDGQPIILFVEQQTTGGYPIVANVIAADLHRVGQLQAGDKVRFAEVSIAEAVDILRQQESWLMRLVESKVESK
jgi:antagonist of KipI